MKKKLSKKIIVIATILLFLGLAVKPITSLETIRNNSIKSVKEVSVSSGEIDCDCEVVDNEYPVFVEQKLHKIEVMVRLLSIRYGDIPEVKEKCNEILELLDSDRPLCDLLQILVLGFLALTSYYFGKLYDSDTTIGLIIYGCIFLVAFGMMLLTGEIYSNVLHCNETNFTLNSYLPLNIYISNNR